MEDLNVRNDEKQIFIAVQGTGIFLFYSLNIRVIKGSGLLWLIGFIHHQALQVETSKKKDLSYLTEFIDVKYNR